MITERNEKILWKESSHAALHHFVSPPKDRERAGRFSPPFPLLRAILLDQSVTKRYKNVFHSWRAYNGDSGDPLGEREALHGSSRACVGGIRTPGGNVDSWNGHPRGGDPWHPTASISPLCHASNVQRCASKRRKKRERRKEEKPIDFSKIDKQFPWRRTFAGPMDRLSKSQVGQLVEIDREFADWSKSAFLSRSESNL